MAKRKKGRTNNPLLSIGWPSSRKKLIIFYGNRKDGSYGGIGSLGMASHGAGRARRNGWSLEQKTTRRVAFVRPRLQHAGQGGPAHDDDPVAIEPDGSFLFQRLEGAPDHLTRRSHDGRHLLLRELLLQAEAPLAIVFR